jgi:hypothetical protein
MTVTKDLQPGRVAGPGSNPLFEKAYLFDGLI